MSIAAMSGNPLLPIEHSHPDKPGHPRWMAWTAAIGLAAVVGVAFYPALQNGFCYDDDTNIVRNLRFRGLGRDQLAWMFTSFKAGHYQPLSWVSLGLDYLLWGDRPFGYHLTNLVLHAGNTVLVFCLGLRLLAWRPNRSIIAPSPTPEGWSTLFGAVVAALLFAVHPLRVESVAWVTERRDVLSSFFLLLTVLIYLRAQRCERRSSYLTWIAVSVIVFALSLLSRAMGVTLPVVLLVLDWHVLGRWGQKGSGPFARRVPGTAESSEPFALPRGLTPLRRNAVALLLEKTPYLILAFAAAVVAPFAQRSVGAAAQLAHHGVLARITQSCYGLVFYVWKTVAPWGLVPMYELRTPLQVTSAKYAWSACGVVAALVALVLLGRRARAVTAAGLCYGILLFPVLGFFQSGQQEVADRYSYLPGIVVALLIGGGLARLWRGVGFTPTVHRMVRAVSIAAAFGVSALLGVLTWRQCGVWKDAESLWSHAVAHGPPCATAHFNLAGLRGQQGRTREARDHYAKALEINPRYPDAWYNLGNAFTELGQPDKAEQAYLRAVRINANHVTAWYHLGNARSRQNKTDEAIAAYREAIKLRAGYVEAWINLGNQHWQKEQREEAILAYEEAVRLNSDHVEARINLGGALAATGRPEEAVVHLREAVRLEPRNAEAQSRLAQLEAHLEGASSPK